MECNNIRRMGKVIRKCPQPMCKMHKNNTNCDTKCSSAKRSCLKSTVYQERGDSFNGNDYKQKNSVSNNALVDKNKGARNPRITRGKSCDLSDHKELYKAGNTLIEVSVKGPRDKQMSKSKSEKLKSNSVESTDSADDSVDIVPVKLQSCAKKCSCHGKSEVTVTTEVKSAGKHKKSEQTPTWDYLLRDKDLLKSYIGNNKNILQNKEPVVNEKNCVNDNPLNTIDCLIKELRKKLRTQCEDVALQQIIADMESALLKIPGETKQDTHDQEKQALSMSSEMKDKNVPGDEIERENVKQLQLKLEESCEFLQKMCEQMQETCRKQQVDKDELSMHLAESRRLLVVAKKKEKDYEARIDEAKLALEAANAKSDQQLKSIHQLTQILSKLQEENKTVGPLREAQAKLTNRLKAVTLQLENVSSKLQLVTLEKDKLAVLLQEKDAKLMAMRKSIADIQNLVGTNLVNMPVMHNSSDTESITTTLSTSLPTSHSNKVKTPEIICSSPASSLKKGSPTPSASWRKISSIYKKPAVNHKDGIKEIFFEMKKQTRLKPTEFVLPRASDTSDTSGFSDSSDTDVPPRRIGFKTDKTTGKITFVSDSLRSDESS